MKLSTMTLFSLGWNAAVTAWSPRTTPQRGGPRSVGGATRLQARQAGTFFNQVPENDDNDDNGSNNKEKKDSEPLAANDDDDSFETQAAELLRQRKVPSLASQPSTINGKPTAGVGFGQKINPPGDSKPFVGIGPPLNDPTKPEYDDQGYTLYADEKTGAKSRVFEALVDYPCKFTMKIVGADEGNFVEEMVVLVAESCEVEPADVSHSVRKQGKWSSVTVKAPVKSAEMLYSLYETVDKDPRVKFKF